MPAVRILHVVTNMDRGGLETMIMNYYRHIDRDKVQFDFLVHREKKAEYDDEIIKLGGKIHRISRLVPWDRNYRKALDEFFENHPEYKVVHVHQDCLSSIALKSAKKSDVPVRIAHSHNSNQPINLKLFIKKYYMRFIPKYATDLFACGKEAGDWMFGGAPYSVLNNAIEAKSFTINEENRSLFREKYGIAENTFVVGHAGRFFLQKNHSFLIDIFKEINNRDKNSILLLVGDGSLKLEMEEKVKKLGLYNNVIFTGVRSDMENMYQIMDAFVFPSLFEGLGMVAVEAQAAGLKCYISDKVPDECRVTELVEKISLEKPASEWAEKILSERTSERPNTYKSVADAGYDVSRNADWLQNYYLSKFKEVK